MTRFRKKKSKLAAVVKKRFFILALLFLLLGVTSYAFYLFPRTLFEVPDNEMIVIPPDIQKLIEEKERKKNTGAVELKVRIPVLLYHYVEYVQDKGDKIRQSLNVEPWALDKQIETLTNDGYTFVFASEVAEMIDGKREVPLKPIVLTFDDGYKDFYTDVFPILIKHKVKAVGYVVPNFINNRNSMNSFQLEKVAKSPYVEIGAHTMDHTWLRGIKNATAEYEIKQSKKQLEEELKIKIVSFAYPYGAFDEQAINLVKDAGYTNAVSTLPGIDESKTNRFFFYRLRPGYRTGNSLLEYLKQDSFKAY